MLVRRDLQTVLWYHIVAGAQGPPPHNGEWGRPGIGPF
jgi:hypothetical protein